MTTVTTCATQSLKTRALSAVYNAESPWSHEDDFFVSIIEDFAPIRPDRAPHILDLGCGTGRLTMGLRQLGYQVTGLDPARASLDIARTQAGI